MTWRGPRGVSLQQVHMVVLSRDAAGQRLAHGSMGKWERGVSDREKASRGHSLFRDENIFREVSWQRIADSDLGDASAPIAISLRVIDRAGDQLRVE